MIFENQDGPISIAEIENVEAELGLRFPNSLKKLFLENNGGSPIPYVLHTQDHWTTVSDTLPLRSSKSRGTAVDCYKILVLKRELVPRELFPFAVDSGGDYFFCGLYTESGISLFIQSRQCFWREFDGPSHASGRVLE